jgi:ATP phosphoribosyltransferase
LEGLAVLFQRPTDIVTSVRDGSVDFGITGWDVYAERQGENGATLPLLKELGFGACSLNVIVPESWEEVCTMGDLVAWRKESGRPLRAATKYPNLTEAFFREHGIQSARMIRAEGTLEIAPTIGYADVIVDLVSTGTTLRDNRLKPLDDGLIVRSEACLIANKAALKKRPKTLAMARGLLEFIVAYLRAAENVSVFANVRADTADVRADIASGGSPENVSWSQGVSPPQAIAQRIFDQSVIGGLQGPTISPVFTRDGGDWYAVHLVVRKDCLAQAIAELRQIGGSGVVVAPVSYIFEEEPRAYRQMLAALED